MKGRFLSIRDLNKKEIKDLFILTKKLKLTNSSSNVLQGKNFALVFEKPSLRTRVTFEVAIHQLGGKSIYLSPQDIGLGTRESVKDVAQNLSQWVDGIIARVFDHHTLIELAKYATIPVINALSDLEHPCQALADLFTIYEKFDNLENLRFVYVGDGNNVCRSLILIFNIYGLRMWIATPKEYAPGAEYIKIRNIRFSNNPIEVVKDADIVYTDVWASMGQEKERDKRLKVFKDFQVNSILLSYAKPNCLIMHCLPAHRGEEITSEVLDSPNSIVLEQSANRLHTQKALLIKLYSSL